MSFFPASLENLIDKFASLPGIGRKSAQRLAFYVLGLPEEEAKNFAEAILEAKANVHCCRICQKDRQEVEDAVRRRVQDRVRCRRITEDAQSGQQYKNSL